MNYDRTRPLNWRPKNYGTLKVRPKDSPWWEKRDRIWQSVK